MTKPVNIYTLSRIEDEEVFNKMKLFYSQTNNERRIPIHEIATLKQLVQLYERLCTEKFDVIEQLDGFFFSYEIPQIGKEFDLLKIDTQRYLNIELKSEMKSEEDILNQLRQKKHYLVHLGKQGRHFLFIKDASEHYELIEDALKKVSFVDIYAAIKELSQGWITEIDPLFKVSNFLVSPLNASDRFLNGEYFLTEHQEEIKKNIFNEIKGTQSHHYIKIQAGPGTGKTLLLYDIAKELAKTDNVLIIHCAPKTTSGQAIINTVIPNITIKIPKEFKLEEAKEYQYILIDETQRIYKETFEGICQEIKNNGNVGIFSIDPKQTLSIKEQQRNIEQIMDTLQPLKEYTLTKKIRTNKEIAKFYDLVLDQNKTLDPQITFCNISLYYAETDTEVKSLIRYMKKQDYQFIKYTSSNRYISLYDTFAMLTNEDTHHVIGQEFDNVLMLMDGSFYYENEKLRAHKHPNPDYLYRQLFYQGVSRVREKLALVVIRNKPLFETISNILTHNIEIKDKRK